jgi:nucleotide-binding universal stress UspA family protein
MAEPLAVEGEPAEQILATIAREKSDLVVIGVKRRRFLAEAIFGSISAAVLHHAPCSVLVVPVPQGKS